MKKRLQILHLEDSDEDAELIHYLLRQGGFDCRSVMARGQHEFERAISEGPYDLILSDFQLGDYDGFSALREIRNRYPQVPFVLVSGTIGEERAVESLKAGATDYVLKTRLERLVPAVTRALEESERREELSRAEEAMRQSEYKYRHLFEV